MTDNYPLNGIKVLDLSRVLAGPWASQNLADLGAKIYKIEHPTRGDDTRKWGPPYLKNENGETDKRMSAYFASANKGKQSISVDIATKEGQSEILALLEECDVLIENFKVGGLEKYGLDYASLKNKFPKLIYCSITGFGQTGPDAHRAGYDFMIQAMGGLMSITGSEESGPLKVGVAITDLFTGMYALSAIQAAIIERFNSGLGQHIDIGLFDCQLAMLANQGSNYLNGNIVPGRLGNAHPNIVPYQSFATKDGHFILAIGNDLQFEIFCKFIGEDWHNDPKFVSNEQRVINRDELSNLIENVTKTHEKAYWIEHLSKLKVPVGRINNIDEAMEEPQAAARDMVQELDLPDYGKVRVVNSPIKMSRSKTGTDIAPPLLKPKD